MGKIEIFIHQIYRILELIVAVLMLFGIIVALFGIFKNYTIFYEVSVNTDTFKQYLDRILCLVRQ